MSYGRIVCLYLTKYAKNLFNRWMMEKPIKNTQKDEKEEIKPVFKEAEEKVERLFDNLFSYFGDKNKKTHGTLTKKLSEEVKYKNTNFSNLNVSSQLYLLVFNYD